MKYLVRAIGETATLLMLLSVAHFAFAQGYPQKPILIVAAFPVGSTPDVVARMIGAKLGERVKQQVVVENKLGAGGNIAYETAAKSIPDGYTLLLGSNSLVVNANLYKNLPYDALKDFTPIAQIVTQPFLLVVQSSFQAHSVSELIALAKVKPGKLSFGSSGTGTINHLAGHMFGTITHVKLLHVPYKGARFAITDMLAGRIDMMFLDLPNMMPQLKTGKLRVLATTGTKRAAILPDVPILSEVGVPGLAAEGWYGLIAPAGTPADIVSRVHQEVIAIMNDAEFRAWTAGQGLTLSETNTPGQFAALLRAESVKWAEIVKATGLKPE